MSGGQQVSVGQGSLTFARSGVGISVLQGDLTPSGNAVTVNISGIEIESGISSVIVGGTVINGIAVSANQGNVRADRSVTLTGIAATIATGSPIPSLDANDTFIQSLQGAASLSISAAISGQEIAASHGSLQFSRGTLDGSQASLSTGSFDKNLFVGLSGIQISAQDGIITQDGGEPPPNSTTIRSYAGVGFRRDKEDEREKKDQKADKVERKDEKQKDEKITARDAYVKIVAEKAPEPVLNEASSLAERFIKASEKKKHVLASEMGQALPASAVNWNAFERDTDATNQMIALLAQMQVRSDDEQAILDDDEFIIMNDLF